VSVDLHPRPGATGPQQAAADSGEPDRLAQGLLGQALVVAASRFLELGSWSLWLDEALTLADARHRDSIQNPLGYWLFGLFYDFAPGRPDELALRLPAALCGWLVVPAVHWAFREHLGSRAAAAAALLVALSPWHLYWSQNARFYTLAQLLTLVGGGLVLRAVAAGRAGPAAGGFLCLALAAAAHPSAALLGGALLFAPWLLRAGGVLASTRRTEGLWRVLKVAVLATLFGGAAWMLEVWWRWDDQKGSGNPVHFLLSTGFLLTPLLGLGFLYGAWRLAKRTIPVLQFLLVVTLGSGLLALTLSFFARMSAQYVFVLLPWMAAVAAFPLAASAPGGRVEPEGLDARRGLAYLALLAAPMAIDSGLYFLVRNGDRPRWREAYELVFEERGPYDLVLGMEAPVAEFYLGPERDELRRWRGVTWLDSFRSRVHQEWARFPRRTWLVVNHEQLEDWGAEARGEMERYLAEDCREIEHFRVPWTPRDLDVTVYLSR